MDQCSSFLMESSPGEPGGADTEPFSPEGIRHACTRNTSTPREPDGNHPSECGGQKHPARFKKSPASVKEIDVFEIRTIGLIASVHDGLALAEKVKNSDPELAARIENACETMLSAAALVLRWEKAQVPLDVADAILLVSSELTKARDRERAQSKRRRKRSPATHKTLP
jgi:hypothetical protein